MFLKQERSEMDDYEEEKNFACKEKMLGKISIF